MQKVIRGLVGGLIAFLVIVSGVGALNDTNYLGSALGGNLLSTSDAAPNLYFRNMQLLEQHFNKHGKAMGYASPEAYEKAAASVVGDDASLHKKEKEDGDDIYYLERSNAFVIVSKDGYIRTYYCPDEGRDYYDRQ